MSSGIFSNPATLGLEVKLPQQQQNHNNHHHHPQQQQRSPQNLNHHLHPHNNQHSHIAIVAQPEVADPQARQPCSFSPISRQQQQQSSILSDEEDPIFTSEEGDPKRKISPWQRMKWTDKMVRVLINEVYTIGDEGVLPEANDTSAKKKTTGVGGVIQKKGKWKSVSQAMMEKGFYVSPQQCEDKFNDLNKRYKRVNDILGRGLSCKVVENLSLLDTMDHLPSKTKEEVRKLLNSKHLFFREMCAYHNNTMVEASSSHPLLHQGHKHSESGDLVAEHRLSEEEEEDDDDEDDEDEEEEEYEEVGEGLEEGNGRGVKRGRRDPIRSGSPSTLRRRLVFEVNSVIQDGGRSVLEKRHWLRSQLVQLEEQRVGYEYEAFELEKQRLKWMKYSGKKERDMEHMKLNNERMKLENERMVLIIRQKEMEIQDFSCGRKGELISALPPG